MDMKKLLTAQCTAALMLLAVSCTDERYDLSKIDGTVDFNADVSLPIGSTEFIEIGSFLETDESDEGNAIRLLGPEGNQYYAISFAGGDPIKIDVEMPDISFTPQEMKNVEVALDFQDKFPELVGMDPSLVPVQDLEFRLVAEEADGSQSDPSMEMTIDAPLPDMVVDILSANIESGFKFNFRVSEGRGTLKKGLVIVFPEFLVLEPSRGFEDKIEIADGHTVVLKKDVNVGNSPEVSLNMNLTAMNFEKVPGHGISSSGGKKSLVLEDKVTVSGSVAVDPGSLAVIPSMLKFIMNIDIASVAARETVVKLDLKESLPEPQEVEIGDLPDFLQDDNIRLDLWNPTVCLSVSNNTPLSAELNADFTSYVGEDRIAFVHIGADGPEGNRTDPVALQTGSSRIYLSRQGNSTPDNPEDVDVAVPGLSDLFTRIPEKVVIENVSFSSASDEFVTVDLSNSAYSAEMDYSIEVPLAFGRNLSLECETSVKGMNNIFSGENDFTLDLKKAEIDFILKNTIPLNVSLKAVAIDLAGNELQGVDVQVDGSVAAGTDAKPVSKPVKVIVSANNEVVKSFDGIKFIISAKGSEEYEGLALAPTQGVQLLDIKARVTGSASAALNNDKSDNNE